MMTKRTVLQGGLVFDGVSAEIRAADVAMEGARIVDVGSDLDGDDAVDVRGHTVIPGFVDCHVHVMAPAGVDIDLLPFSLFFYGAVPHLRRILRAGVTLARDASGADAGVRMAVQRGLISGPTLKIAIRLLHQTGGHGDWPRSMPAYPGSPDTRVDGPEAMRSKARELLRAGADVLKVATSGGVMTPGTDLSSQHFLEDELRMLTAVARQAGRPVMAHAQSVGGIKAAIAAGVDSIEHGLALDAACVDMMLAAGTVLVPTLLASQHLVAQLGGAPALEVVDDLHERHLAAVRLAAEAGVPIAMGTDSGVVPHGRNLEELALLHRAGLAPIDVLRAATSVGARLLGEAETRGEIAPGKVADLVVLAGAATEFAGIGARIAQVWQAGNRPASAQPPTRGSSYDD